MNLQGNGTLEEDVFYDYSMFNWSHGIDIFRFNKSQRISKEYESLFDVPIYLVVILSACYGVISVFAVIGNILVIWIVATSRRMQTVTNCFIANLSWADILIGVFVVPFQYQAALLQRWILPAFMCAFCPFVQILSVSVSVFTLTAIALDRHKAILHPLSARVTKLNAKLIIVGIWICGIILATPMLIALRVILEEEHDNANPQITYHKHYCANINFSPKTMMIYRIILFFLQYVVPLCIISFVYIRMALKLWGSKTPGNAQHARDVNLMKNKKKVIKMLHVVVLLFALCWLPLQVYNVLQETVPEINQFRYINIIFFFCDWLAMSNSCYNPFIYGIYNDKFKREFKLRLTKIKKLNQNHNLESFDLNQSQTMKYSNGNKLEQKKSDPSQMPAISYSMHYCSKNTEESHFCTKDISSQWSNYCKLEQSSERRLSGQNISSIFIEPTTFQTIKVDPKKPKQRKVKYLKNSITVKRKDNILCTRKYNINKSHLKRVKINENIFSKPIIDLCKTKFKMESKYVTDTDGDQSMNMEFQVNVNCSKENQFTLPCYRGVVVKRKEFTKKVVDFSNRSNDEVDADIFIFPISKEGSSETSEKKEEIRL